MRKQDIALFKQLMHMENILQELSVRMRHSRSEPTWTMTMTLPSPVRKRHFPSVADMNRVTWSLGSEGSDAGCGFSRCQSHTSGGSSSEDEVLVPGAAYRNNKSFSVPHGPLQDIIKE